MKKSKSIILAIASVVLVASIVKDKRKKANQLNK